MGAPTLAVRSASGEGSSAGSLTASGARRAGEGPAHLHLVRSMRCREPAATVVARDTVRPMADRDVERDVNTQQFVATLRRIADCLEGNEAARIQVQGKRFTIPKTASLSIEHEVSG